MSIMAAEIPGRYTRGTNMEPSILRARELARIEL